MNSEYPPILFLKPQIVDRRKDNPRPITISQDAINRRIEIARNLNRQIEPLSTHLQNMSEEERKAVFYKLEHEGLLPLRGTDLKSISESSGNITLAIPLSENLGKLSAKINDFATGEIGKYGPPNAKLSASLKKIQMGEPKDRLSQALFEEYDNLIQQEWIICEIEIISVLKGAKQQQQEIQEIRNAIEREFASGINGIFFEHEEIKGTLRAVIGCKGVLFKHLVEDKKWQRRISWFDARPEFETFFSTLDNFAVNKLGAIEGPDDEAPVICIIDSGVTVGNPFLEPVTREDIVKSFLKNVPDNPYDENGHGSGVASLAAYYALNLQEGASNIGKVWIASARILNADNMMEEDRLFSKALQEIVDCFVPLGVRVFNLSVNVINRLWNKEAKRTMPRRSWIARTIDRLSREKDIVFVISTGNISTLQVREYIHEGMQYPDYFIDEDANILDPGQAALSLTVGSIAPGTLAVGRVGTATALSKKNQPSPFTRCGPGINKEIKPELVDYGGNYIIDSDGGAVRTNPGTNVMMASHQLTPAINHDSGTSFAAPRVAHKIALILSELKTIGIEDISATLLKAFIVNSASWTGLGEEIDHFVDRMDKLQKKHWLNVIGYGMPDHNKATYCDSYSSVLFHQGEMNPDKVAFFSIPVPKNLSDSESGLKQLTVTVVYSPEVQRWGLEQYLGTKFKWRLFRGDVNPDDVIAAMSDEEENSDTELPNELTGELKITLRSRGTVQHDIFKWTEHLPHYSKNAYTLAIAAYKKWGRPKSAPVPYAVVVRLEDMSHSIPIYSEIQNILIEAESQTRTSV